jgi:GTPase SAR1 family protein
MEDIAKHAPATAVKVLAGNKMDLPHREVTTEEATQAAKEFNVSYLETSAKSNTNISELFDTVLDQILESQK